jgi:hypothetical protein
MRCERLLAEVNCFGGARRSDQTCIALDHVVGTVCSEGFFAA